MGEDQVQKALIQPLQLRVVPGNLPGMQASGKEKQSQPQRNSKEGDKPQGGLLAPGRHNRRHRQRA